MNKLLSLFFLLSSVLANEAGNPIVDVLSAESDPGKGQLLFSTVGNQTPGEKIDFGADAGHFAMGMVLPSEILPPKYQKDFKKTLIIQMAFGNLKPKVKEDLLPQFGMASLFVSALPVRAMKFDIIVAPENQMKWDKTALLWFTSPSTLNSASDQDKLRSSFYGKLGYLILTPLGKPGNFKVTLRGSQHLYRKQIFQLEMNATLATPFSTAKQKVEGTIRIPVYRPQDKGAKELARNIASQLDLGIESLSHSLAPSPAPSPTKKK